MERNGWERSHLRKQEAKMLLFRVGLFIFGYAEVPMDGMICHHKRQLPITKKRPKNIRESHVGVPTHRLSWRDAIGSNLVMSRWTPQGKICNFLINYEDVEISRVGKGRGSGRIAMRVVIP
ncbi:Uncharacterized protein TCM_003997 [Theobroma cacao]|uniref:Uncharacterized protein n=1 Tax=Theobroma cacao TaxID=3641 RepID=A0A061DWM9_THECC|nr:Uncharacterized protein TCM_003997 [Theobroma cacao]